MRQRIRKRDLINKIMKEREIAINSAQFDLESKLSKIQENINSHDSLMIAKAIKEYRSLGFKIEIESQDFPKIKISEMIEQTEKELETALKEDNRILESELRNIISLLKTQTHDNISNAIKAINKYEKLGLHFINGEFQLPEIDESEFITMIKDLQNKDFIPVNIIEKQNKMFLFTAHANGLIDIEDELVFLSSKGYKQMKGGYISG